MDQTKNTNIDSLSQALLLLQVVSEHPDTGLSELARLCHLNKSRTYRMLSTLVAHHFVIQTEKSKYRLGNKLLFLGQNAKNQTDWLNLSENIAETLIAEFHEDIQIRLRDHMEIVQVWKKYCSNSAPLHTFTKRHPLGLGASGKLLLAFAPEDIQRTFIEHQPEEEKISYSESLYRIQQQKYVMSHNDIMPNIYEIAVPIFDAQQYCLACLTLSAPSERMPEERVEKILSRLKRASKDIFMKQGGIFYQ